MIVQEVLKGDGSFGYNVATGKFEDLMKAGVVDPTKVTRASLQNAASIASLLLTTECMISEMPEEKCNCNNQMAGMNGMDGMM